MAVRPIHNTSVRRRACGPLWEIVHERFLYAENCVAFQILVAVDENMGGQMFEARRVHHVMQVGRAPGMTIRGRQHLPHWTVIRDGVSSREAGPESHATILASDEPSAASQRCIRPVLNII